MINIDDDKLIEFTESFVNKLTGEFLTKESNFTYGFAMDLKNSRISVVRHSNNLCAQHIGLSQDLIEYCSSWFLLNKNGVVINENEFTPQSSIQRDIDDMFIEEFYSFFDISNTINKISFMKSYPEISKMVLPAYDLDFISLTYVKVNKKSTHEAIMKISKDILLYINFRKGIVKVISGDVSELRCITLLLTKYVKEYSGFYYNT